LLVSLQKYGSESGELLAAVQQLAGPATGLSIVDKASRAVNILKVLQALESIVAALKVGCWLGCWLGWRRAERGRCMGDRLC
jgi:hypothetical protein